MTFRIAVGLLLPILAVGKVLGVGIINRHGDREVLVKDSSGFVESTHGTLTPKGYTRMEWLGTVLRQRYITGNSQPFLNTNNFPILHSQVNAISSSVDRTVASANAIIGGLFQSDVAGRVPVVYTLDSIIDITIRSYQQCDKFKDLVQVRRNHSSFTIFEQTTQDLRTEVATTLNVTDSKLEDVWNLHDEVIAYLALSEDQTDPLIRAKLKGHLPELSNLLNWISDYDYESAVQVPVACNLLSEITSFIHGVVDGSSSVRFNMWSGHYPTLISLAKLLSFDDKVKGVPGFGAAIIFEVIEDDSSKARRVEWYYVNEGDNWDPTNTTAAWNHIRSSSPTEYNHLQCTVEEWCDECSYSVPICLKNQLYNTHTTITEPCDIYKTIGVIAGSVIAGFVIGYTMSLLSARNRRKRKQHEKHVHEMKPDIKTDEPTC